MTRVLITGITGQDGSYLVDRLVEDGVEIWGLVRPGDADAVAVRPEVSRDHLIEADLAEPASIADAVARVTPDEVFHLAGVSSVAQSWTEPVLTGAVTGLGAVAVMRAALDANAECKVLLASSAEIYAGQPRDHYDEASAIAPLNPYGAAKAYAHHMARIMRSQGAFVSTAVLFNHESPRRPLSFVTRKITQGAAAIALGRASELVLGNLDAQRDWGWAPDYVDAMMRAARHHVADEFVVATGTSHSVRDFALAALSAAKVDGGEQLITSDPRFVRAADAPVLIGDASKARAELGWETTKSFEEIVAAMVHADLSGAAPQG